MKKIKKVWIENRVLFILGAILLICIAVVTTVSITYFYGTSDTEYGNRLEDIEKAPLNKKLFEDIKEALMENKSVEDVVIKTQGKIVYISIDFAAKTKMEDAKKIADKVVPLFNDDELEIYDLQFTIVSESADKFVGYTLMGAYNANGLKEIVWNNYNIQEEVE